MVVEERKKKKVVTRYSDVRYGEIFSMADYMGGISTTQKFLMCQDRVVNLDTFVTYPYSYFYECFEDEYRRLDEDEKDYFIDTFDDREVKIYDATLTIEVD